MFNDTDVPHSIAESPGSGFGTGFEAGLDDQAPQAVAAPPRFGRLALCVAAASALALGVVGTVAYGIWFNHDQQAYAEAMTGARQALGVAGASAAVTAVAAVATVPAKVAVPVAVVAPQAVSPGFTASSPRAAAFSQSSPSSRSSAILTAAPATLTSSGEEGAKQAVWAGEVKRAAPDAASAGNPPSSVADAAPAAPAGATLPAHSTRQQQLAANRQSKDWRSAQQERRASAANARHKGSLFARMSQFFRRVNYRQHDGGSGNGSQQQDVYSHP
ncbi:hypothetical protein [Paraburkholderia sp. BCC1884]|uniref:hypothetical protein n=1 Tax=Paraburkholderia sp. BCC1884 TaxID=2562668 RepID=UPI0011837B7A|nr:hypothetical protein [Paraburkholderia sp. BCC1884]